MSGVNLREKVRCSFRGEDFPGVNFMGREFPVGGMFAVAFAGEKFSAEVIKFFMAKCQGECQGNCLWREVPTLDIAYLELHVTHGQPLVQFSAKNKVTIVVHWKARNHAIIAPKTLTLYLCPGP